MQCLSVRERNSMTLQIGLVGSDGVVLASDRLVSIVEAQGVTRTRSSKVHIGRGVVCCWAGDDTARYAANLIQASAWPENMERYSILQECADEAWRLTMGGEGTFNPLSHMTIARRVLVAFADGELWKVDIFVRSAAQKIFDKVIAGDSYTSVHHLINNYIPTASLPVSSLLQIAAHAICMGHRENPAGIDGLEVAVIRDGTITVLSPDQEKELQELSAKIHGDIQSLLSQPYSIGA